MSLDELLADFVNVIEKIFELQEKKSIKKNPVKDKFLNYQKCLSKTEISEHLDFFLSPFRKNRLPILADKSDKWIRDGSIHIQFNEGAKTENPKFRIMLSAIYKNALNIAKDARLEFDSLMGKEKLSLAEAYPQVKHPDLLLYTYYRLVHYFLQHEFDDKSCGMDNNPDINKLGEVIKTYESHLGIKKGSGEGNSNGNGNPNGNGNGPNGNPSGGINDILNSPAIGNIISTGIEVMKKNGMNPPADFKAPSGEEISTMINGFLGNPKVKGFISNMMETMQNSKTPDQLLNGLQKQLGNGGMLQDLLSSVGSSSSQTQTSSSQTQTSSSPSQNQIQHQTQHQTSVGEIVKDAVKVEENLINISENPGNPGNVEENEDLIVTFD